MTLQYVLLGAGVLLLVLVVWVIATFNRLVRLRQYVRESWSGIDVELKRRYNLIPNLVETVKGYAAHERSVLERVMELRSQAMAPHDSVHEHAADEQRLMHEMKRLFALVEAYPALKADRHFLELQQELANTEDRIAAARRFFNGNVRDFNALVMTIPSNLIASAFGFKVKTFFELDSAAERVVPRAAVGSYTQPAVPPTGDR